MWGTPNDRFVILISRISDLGRSLRRAGPFISEKFHLGVEAQFARMLFAVVVLFYISWTAIVVSSGSSYIYTHTQFLLPWLHTQKWVWHQVLKLLSVIRHVTCLCTCTVHVYMYSARVHVQCTCTCTVHVYMYMYMYVVRAAP